MAGTRWQGTKVKLGDSSDEEVEDAGGSEEQAGSNAGAEQVWHTQLQHAQGVLCGLRKVGMMSCRTPCCRLDASGGIAVQLLDTNDCCSCIDLTTCWSGIAPLHAAGARCNS